MNKVIEKQDFDNLRYKNIKEKVIIKQVNPLDEYKETKIRSILDDSPKVLTMRKNKKSILF